MYVAVFIEHATPFMEEFLDRLATLNYPTARIRLFIHNNVRVAPHQSHSHGQEVSVLTPLVLVFPPGRLSRAPHPQVLGAPPSAFP